MNPEDEIESLRKTVAELRDYIREMLLGESIMNAASILAILQIVAMLQQMKEGQDLPDTVRREMLGGVIEGTDEEIAAVDDAIQKVSPNFLGNLLKGVGELLSGILGD